MKRDYTHLMIKSWINYRTVVPSLTVPHLVPQGGSKKEDGAGTQSIGKNKDRLFKTQVSLTRTA